MQHRAAPHHRCVVLEEEPDRHQLQVATHGRHDHRVDDDRALLHAEHVRDRVAVDVGVENTHALAGRAQRRGQVRRQRRLADAALARRDRKHAGGRIERDRLLRPAAAEARRQRRLLVGAHHVEVQLHRRNARDRADGALHLVLERRAHRAAGDGQRDRDLDRAVTVNDDIPHHVELGDGLVQLGIDHALERTQDRVALRCHRRLSVPVPRSETARLPERRRVALCV